ncbi:MAG: purine-nucleoside phosphorylase [Gemmatimonadaceae bacterium]|nr:purine-nucleoside phosphorylase [Gemmatimonadaceae bacterium]
MADASSANHPLAEAAAFLRTRLPVQAPVAAIVLGSGLGGLAARISGATRVAYRDIPGFAEPRVEGHAGELLHGTLGGREVLALAGRFHMYEGHAAAHSAFPVRVVHALGARTLILSNAAGGIRRTFAPGQLMVIADHLNLMFRNPLIGQVQPGDERFPDMSSPYDPDLRQRLHAIARGLGIRLEDGVYAGLLGPSYETPAEVRMLERLGADAAGMSTVPEVMVARAMGMRCAAVSCITNPGAGLSPEPIHHADVIEVTRRAAADFERLIEALVASL